MSCSSTASGRNLLCGLHKRRMGIRRQSRHASMWSQQTNLARETARSKRLAVLQIPAHGFEDFLKSQSTQVFRLRTTSKRSTVTDSARGTTRDLFQETLREWDYWEEPQPNWDELLPPHPKNVCCTKRKKRTPSGGSSNGSAQNCLSLLDKFLLSVAWDHPWQNVAISLMWAGAISLLLIASSVLCSFATLLKSGLVLPYHVSQNLSSAAFSRFGNSLPNCSIGSPECVMSSVLHALQLSQSTPATALILSNSSKYSAQSEKLLEPSDKSFALQKMAVDPENRTSLLSNSSQKLYSASSLLQKTVTRCSKNRQQCELKHSAVRDWLKHAILIT